MRLLGLESNINTEKVKIKRPRIDKDTEGMVMFYCRTNSKDKSSNLTQRDIATMVGISQASVSKIIKKHKEKINDL